ncbi:MAG: hypothetical protein ACYCT9_09765 [Leptospirillum sp.]
MAQHIEAAHILMTSGARQARIIHRGYGMRSDKPDILGRPIPPYGESSL